jgi:NAD dependent epimerase/dehydratase family enzyme
LVSQRALPEALRATGFLFHHPDALTALQWAITSD